MREREDNKMTSWGELWDRKVSLSSRVLAFSTTAVVDPKIAELTTQVQKEMLPLFDILTRAEFIKRGLVATTEEIAEGRKFLTELTFGKGESAMTADGGGGNPNHDEHGRFAESPGGSSAEAAAKRVADRSHGGELKYTMGEGTSTAADFVTKKEKFFNAISAKKEEMKAIHTNKKAMKADEKDREQTHTEAENKQKIDAEKASIDKAIKENPEFAKFAAAGKDSKFPSSGLSDRALELAYRFQRSENGSIASSGDIKDFIKNVRKNPVNDLSKMTESEAMKVFPEVIREANSSERTRIAKKVGKIAAWTAASPFIAVGVAAKVLWDIGYRGSPNWVSPK